MHAESILRNNEDMQMHNFLHDQVNMHAGTDRKYSDIDAEKKRVEFANY